MSHSMAEAGVGSIDFSAGVYTPGTLMPSPAALAHGLLMALGTGIMIPLGAAMARFAKRVTPSTGPKAFWFRSHRAIQSTGLVLSAVGVVVAFVLVVPAGYHLQDPHHICGTVSIAYMLLQVLSVVLAERLVGY
jgi:hypothetical protein